MKELVLLSGSPSENGKLLNTFLQQENSQMLYLGIDQHARQITISLRNEDGDVIQARQVSTRPEKINEFFQRLTRERLRDGESFVAVLEVGGFGDWLIDMLSDYR